MKKNIYIVLLLLAFSSCKSLIVTPGSTLPNETGIKFGVVRDNSESEKDVFIEGDQAGIYMIETTKAAEFADFKAKNYGYFLQNNFWTAMNVAENLRWIKDGPEYYFYSYSPRAKAGSAVVLADLPVGASADTAVKYTLPLDQSAQVVKGYDLLRAVSTGVDNKGWSLEIAAGDPVSMSYKHVLAKIQFNIYITKQQDIQVPTEKANILGVRVVSKDIAQGGVLSLKEGNITTVVSEDQKTWLWAGNKEMNILPLNIIDPITVPFSFVVSPFEVSNLGTWFEFEVQYVNDKSVIKNFVARHILPADGSMKFVQGKKSVFRVEINLSNQNIEIESVIVDWNEENYIINPVG